MVERAFARTLRNYSTVFFIVAALSFPLHTMYSFLFRDVIATREHHAVIEAGPQSRRIGKVGHRDLESARLGFGVVMAVELALVPLMVRATRRVFVIDEKGGVPTATDGWRAALSPGSEPPRDRISLQGVGAGVVVALLGGFLIHLIAGSATGFLTDGARWVGVGLGQSLVRAAAAPLALGPLALFRAKEEGDSAPKF